MSTVLVTGATDGLGLALATRLAGEGTTFLAHARSEERGPARRSPTCSTAPAMCGSSSATWLR